jgi:hypothetical protein
MRTMRQRLAAVTLLGGLTTLGIGLSAGPASAVSVDTCTNYLGDAQSGSLHLNTTPAAGSTVAAGSDLSLTSSWNENDFNETDRLYVCGSVDGLFSPAMSLFQVAVNNDGSLTLGTTIPSSVPVGSNVCVTTALEGRLANLTQGEMVSETRCYTSSAAVVTTTTLATTTTTVAPRVVEPTVDPNGTGAGTTSGPAVEAAPVVAGEVAVAPAPLPVLPRTGSGIDVLAGFGGIALAVGGLTRFLGRRRPAVG